jgi:hypothetical protein
VKTETTSFVGIANKQQQQIEQVLINQIFLINEEKK